MIDRTEWQKSQRMESRWERVFGWLCIVFSACAALWMMLFAYEVLIARGVLVGA